MPPLPDVELGHLLASLIFVFGVWHLRKVIDFTPLVTGAVRKAILGLSVFFLGSLLESSAPEHIRGHILGFLVFLFSLWTLRKVIDFNGLLALILLVAFAFARDVAGARTVFFDAMRQLDAITDSAKSAVDGAKTAIGIGNTIAKGACWWVLGPFGFLAC